MWNFVRKSRIMTCLAIAHNSLFPPIFNPSNLRNPSRSLHSPLSKLSPFSPSLSLSLPVVLLSYLTTNSIANQSTRLSAQGFFLPSPSLAIRSYCSKGSGRMGDGVIQNPDCISYLTQREAAEIDELLMGPLGFSVDQLMVILESPIYYPSFFFFHLMSLLIIILVYAFFFFGSCN